VVEIHQTTADVYTSQKSGDKDEEIGNYWKLKQTSANHPKPAQTGGQDG